MFATTPRHRTTTPHHRGLPFALGAAAILGIRLYQVMARPFLVGTCPHLPSCSEYAIEAVDRHGVLRGMILALRRLLRCRPFCRGGYDPVPRPKQMNRHRSWGAGGG